jgi:tetratricopeptide (TPR) repeat protein
MNKRSSTFGEAAADDFFLTEASYNSLDIESQQMYRWALTDYTFPGDWAALYNTVFNANLCLESLQKIGRTPVNAKQWDNVKGSALFFRAYSFLSLSWTFCKAYDKTTSSTDYGIPLRMTSDFNVPSTRAKLEESYQQVIQDLYEAVPLLENLSEVPLRPSKAAAYGTLARTYLSMRLYDSAFKYSDAALQIHNGLMDYNDIDLTSYLPFTKFNEEVIFYSAVGLYALSTVHPYYARIDSNLYHSYLDNDLRKEAFFIPVSDGSKFKGMYSDNANQMFTGIATDEMLLDRAECEARLGKTPEAMADLNRLLEKRFTTGTFVPVTVSGSDEALNKILEERRKELLMRTLRFIDIKRLNLEGRNITPLRIIDGEQYKLPPNSNRYALPLPKDVIDLSGMSQNPL